MEGYTMIIPIPVKDTPVVFRVTAHDKDLIQRAALAERQRPSEWLRDMALRKARLVLRKADSDDLGAI
jgi:uncharacterized protein (DUF1778 family)